MILVIFGAGASYDSVPTRRPDTTSRPAVMRPPLANELFYPESFFGEILAHFPECSGIVPLLRSFPAGTTFEQRLEQLQAEGDRDPIRKSQLAAVRFYLREMLWNCENRWRNVSLGVTNYHSLIDLLRRGRKPSEPVLLVTFNYDRLIEDALRGFGVEIEINEFFDYTASELFKLYKLHGSVHWTRVIETKLASTHNSDQNAIRREIIRRMPELKISGRYRIIENYGRTSADGVALFPAIALPVEVKSHFECPDDHVASLCAHLPKVSKILIVGWRGAEKHFLKLLKENLRQRLPTQIVTGDHGSAMATVAELTKAGIETHAEPFDGGFTEYIVNGAAQRFFKQP